jgi:long-chain-acyl-CoA dehydrogenase
MLTLSFSLGVAWYTYTRTEICVGRAFVDRCLELLREGRLDTATASMAKYWLTDLQNKVANDAVQLHGGWGYMWEFPGE